MSQLSERHLAHLFINCSSFRAGVDARDDVMKVFKID